MLDLFCIGESQRDIFYFLQEANVHCQLNTDRCELCLPYADKIPVETVVKVPAAGNSANAAVAAQRLGCKTGIMTWIGTDRAGEHLHHALREEKIDLTHVHRDKLRPTSESTILVFQGEKTQLVHFQPHHYQFTRPPSARGLYYSAMGTISKSFDRQLVHYLETQSKQFFTFQPGTTHLRAGLSAMDRLIERSNLLVLNLEEARLVLGQPTADMFLCLDRLQRVGGKTIVITDGKNGAWAHTDQEQWFCPVFPVKPKEATGAGDAFAATLTVALLQEKPLDEALRMATAQSASVIQHIGPQQGLLKMDALKKVMSKFSKIRPTRI